MFAAPFTRSLATTSTVWSTLILNAVLNGPTSPVCDVVVKYPALFHVIPELGITKLLPEPLKSNQLDPEPGNEVALDASKYKTLLVIGY
jgi:hypothetical protein